MTTLCRVVLPLRPLHLPSTEWRWVPLPFCLLSHGVVQRRGTALPDQMPVADRWELLLPPVDVTLLNIPAGWLAEVPRHQWRHALPNLIEPWVLGAVEDLHCALSRRAGELDRVAVMDRAWLAFVHAAFASRSTALAIFVASDWLAPGQGSEWRFPTLEGQDDGWVTAWREEAGTAGGLRGRAEDRGVLPWRGVAAWGEDAWETLLGQERRDPEGIDLCQFEWASRGLRQWGRIWRSPLWALWLLLGVMGVGLVAQWARLEWQTHVWQQREQAALQRLGQLPPPGTPLSLWAHVQAQEVPRPQGMTGEFVQLSQDLADLLSRQPALVPVAWHYRDHHLAVRFAPGGQPEALVAEAQRRGWRWQAQNEGWVFEEGHP